MIATLSAIAVFASVATPAIEINVNAKNGDVIAGEVVFRVTVQASHPVTQVEFYVGEELRESDSSTPYEFKLDTLAEKEGAIRVMFAAYTTENESAKKALDLTIDNGIAKGPEFHTARANDLLTVSKWDEAILAARVALKAKAGFNPARLAMARAYLGKGTLDLAQKFAEDAIAADPGFVEASELLSVINLQRAFNTFHRGTGEQMETLAVIRDAMKSAVELRRKNLDAALDKLGAPTSANWLAYADAAIRAHRYTAAIQALNIAYRTDSTKPEIVNRLAYAQMRISRMTDAVRTFAESKRRGTVDAYGYALLAILEANGGNDAAADDAISEAFLNEPENLGVRTAQAFIALQRGKMDVLAKVAGDLAKDNSARTEVQYYLAALYHALAQFTESRRAFERATLAEPLNYDMFVERGVESLWLVALGKLDEKGRAYQIAVAKTFFETALVAKAESAEALTGLALTSMFEKKSADSLRYAQAAAAAMPSYPAGHFALAMAMSQVEADLRARAESIRRSSRDGSLTAEQQTEIRNLLQEADRYGRSAQAENDTAGKLDTIRLQGRGIPTVDTAFSYFARWGRLPLITPPK